MSMHPLTLSTQPTKLQKKRHRWHIYLPLLIMPIISGLVASLYLTTSVEDYFAQHGNVLQFRFRQWIGRSPYFDKKLKVLSFDDRTVGKLESSDLSYEDWAKIITLISKYEPKHIVIDKKFGLIDEKEKVEIFIKALEKAPVYVGAYTQHTLPIDIASYLPLEGKNFDLPNQVEKNKKNYKWLNFDDYSRAFGPHKSIRPYFAGIGHFNYRTDGRVGSILPYKVVENNRLLPHVSLLTAEKSDLLTSGPLINGNKVFLDRFHMIPVNFPSLSILTQNIKSLLPVILRARKGMELTTIEKGDTVVILPLMYTGSVDFGETPLGRMPLGYVIVSLINSVLSGQWLKTISFEREFVFVVTTLCSLIGIGILSPIIFGLVLLFLNIIIVGISLLCFSYFDLMLPWTACLFGANIGAVCSYSERLVKRMKLARSYEIALTGLVTKKSLDHLLRHPQALQREAREKKLSIMFIDLVRFSEIAARTSPKDIFERLKNILSMCTECVHEHGGVVDKTLGDGMLCFFGYDFIADQENHKHPDQAIQCAIALQMRALEMNKIAFSQREPIIPMRIGINTDRVYIGDLGNHERLDFTLIGNGVNFAQRLEAACEPYRILISRSTLKRSSVITKDSPGISERKIKVKHHLDLVDVIEIDPFWNKKEEIENFLNEMNPAV